MKKYLSILLLLTVVAAAMAAVFMAAPRLSATTVNEAGSLDGAYESEDKLAYDELGLRNCCSYKAFSHAIAGYKAIKKHDKEILVVIDFSKPSTEERLFVIDMAGNKLLCKTHVAHGKNSGMKYATSFSNKPGSYQSSLGFYITGGTYEGRNGYSLLLDGLEKDINDKARERAIVIHGAEYADPEFIAQQGRLGRSFGCPALPTGVNKEVIDIIKGGAVLFIYAENAEYLAKSPILAGA